MKDTGIVRKIDPLGRLVIPKETRDLLGLGTNEPVQIFVEGDFIKVKKYIKSCLICGSTTDVKPINGKNICQKCKDMIKGDS